MKPIDSRLIRRSLFTVAFPCSPAPKYPSAAAGGAGTHSDSVGGARLSM